MTDLVTAPNIGPALAADLRQAGIHDLATLHALGAAGAWERMRGAGLRDCANSLLALEGAIRGVPWVEIDAVERRRITARAARFEAA